MKKCILLFFIGISFFSCRKDIAYFHDTAYPDPINHIFLTKCATSGCHDDKSFSTAGGLNLGTWGNMFKGGNGGSVVIPFRSDESWLQFFINIDSTKGICLKPTMPYLLPPLSDKEIDLVRNWIDAGAPDYSGNIAFASSPNRKKYYVANQGCDEVTVFDSETKLAMRYIKVGVLPDIETPHMIRVSPDNQFWYVVFAHGPVIQKFRCSDDALVGTLDISNGNNYINWNTMLISPDGKKGFAVNWAGVGAMVYMDLENMVINKFYQGSGLFNYPHGITASSDFKTLYVTAQYGNYIYKIDITDPDFPIINHVVLETGAAETSSNTSLNPHEVLLSPDGAVYFVTCQFTNEVRVLKTSNDSLLAVIPVGDFPQELVVSFSHPYLFVTCSNDPCSASLCEGSVAVINYENFDLITTLQSRLYQPHGIAVDDDYDRIIIANRNLDVAGPLPHHSSECGGRNGFLRVVNMSTFNFEESYHAEVSVDPYSVAVRK